MTPTLPVLGAPLQWHPVALSLLLLVITPGVHLLASPLIEGRRISWRDDYPAVLIGDPLLTVAAGIGLWLAEGRLHWTAHWRYGLAVVVGGLAFGWLQARAELASGRYTPGQVRSPTKLWHQYVVYPVLGYLVPAATISGLLVADRARWPTVVIVLCIGCWGVLVWDGMVRPRVGHGELPERWHRQRS